MLTNGWLGGEKTTDATTSLISFLLFQKNFQKI
jgi:hypothetical protein